MSAPPVASRTRSARSGPSTSATVPPSDLSGRSKSLTKKNDFLQKAVVTTKETMTRRKKDVLDDLLYCVQYGLIEEKGDGVFFFVHDKIQEAALSLIPHDMSLLMVTIGEILFQKLESDEIHDHLFVIIKLLNEGRNLQNYHHIAKKKNPDNLEHRLLICRLNQHMAKTCRYFNSFSTYFELAWKLDCFGSELTYVSNCHD